MSAVNIVSKLSLFSEYWSPKIVATFNGHDVMVVKLKGEFVWHSHPDAYDFFYVPKGILTIKLRDRDVRLGPGDLYVVPRGVEHCSVAKRRSTFFLSNRKELQTPGTPPPLQLSGRSEPRRCVARSKSGPRDHREFDASWTNAP